MRYKASALTNPVIVIGGSSEGERLRLASAPSAISAALAIYGMAWVQVASWCGVPYPDGALENPVVELRVGGQPSAEGFREF